jgi:hypothetical protein
MAPSNATSVGPIASRTCASPRVWPATATSSPVTMTDTRGRRCTRTRSSPSAAATATCPGPTGVSARNRTSPFDTSSPARRTFVPGSGAAENRTESPVSVASSRRTTASAPTGTGAPVAMRTADPAARAIPQTAPAIDAPTTGSVTGRSAPAPDRSDARTAKPSIAALSNRGSGAVARTSSANTNPAASARGRDSGGSGRTSFRTRASTPSTDSKEGPPEAGGFGSMSFEHMPARRGRTGR